MFLYTLLFFCIRIQAFCVADRLKNHKIPMMKSTWFNEGYPLFSRTHRIVMTGIGIGMTAALQHFRKSDRKKRRKILRTVSRIPLVLETVQDTVLILKHQMNAQYLPLHLCGQAMFLEPLHDSMKKGKTKQELGNMIYSLFLPGAAMALVFPGWNNLPVMNGISLKKYAAHFCLVLYGILIDADGQTDLTKKTFFEDLIYLYGAALLLWPFNNHFDTNYLYTHEPVDPLRWIWDRYGKKTYILVMMTAGVVLISSMYLINHEENRRHTDENTVCD